MYSALHENRESDIKKSDAVIIITDYGQYRKTATAEEQFKDNAPTARAATHIYIYKKKDVAQSVRVHPQIACRQNNIVPRTHHQCRP